MKKFLKIGTRWINTDNITSIVDVIGDDGEKQLTIFTTEHDDLNYMYFVDDEREALLHWLSDNSDDVMAGSRYQGQSLKHGVKFKVGDKVKVNRTPDNMYHGFIGTITELYENPDSLAPYYVEGELSGMKDWCRSNDSELELVDDKPPVEECAAEKPAAPVGVTITLNHRQVDALLHISDLVNKWHTSEQEMSFAGWVASIGKYLDNAVDAISTILEGRADVK